MVNAKRAQLYTLTHIDQENKDSIRNISNILNNWTAIRAIIARFVYTNEYRSDILNSITERLKKIYKLEMTYYNDHVKKNNSND